MVNISKIQNFLTKPINIAPLAVFRIVFGAILFLSTIRFIAKGWVYELYVAPKFYFSYYGFEWVKPLPEPYMCVVFAVMAVSFICISVGLFYRYASIVGFLCFTYLELIDKTNYLNHYYFVSLVLFLLIFVPANRYFAIDLIYRPQLKRTRTPRIYILILQLQLAIVYFYAGLAKLNYDWLINALPLSIWLPAKNNLPLFGSLLNEKWVAYIFSWFGAIYDLTIPFMLFYRRTRTVAYVLVILFHITTWLLFPIGVFPFVMIGATLIFFSPEFHERLINSTRKIIHRCCNFLSKDATPNVFTETSTIETPTQSYSIKNKVTFLILTTYLIIQLLIPFRFLLYPNQLFWSEEGYRFSWRVMLMEKAGYAIFTVKDPSNGKSFEVNNYNYLTPNQEKMMSTQPDMILQFAHFLEIKMIEKGITRPEIYANVFVSLNGRPSKPFIDPKVDLTKIQESFSPKTWVLNSEINE